MSQCSSTYMFLKCSICNLLIIKKLKFLVYPVSYFATKQSGTTYLLGLEDV